MANASASVQALAADRRLTQLRPTGGGAEFQVLETTAPDGSKVVLPIRSADGSCLAPNDRGVDAGSLLRWTTRPPGT
jgi:hypothetical protein